MKTILQYKYIINIKKKIMKKNRNVKDGYGLTKIGQLEKRPGEVFPIFKCPVLDHMMSSDAVSTQHGCRVLMSYNTVG